MHIKHTWVHFGRTWGSKMPETALVTPMLHSEGHNYCVSTLNYEPLVVLDLYIFCEKIELLFSLFCHFLE